MSPMRLRYPQPANEDDFVLLSVRLLQHHWSCPSLQRYGRRGQKQNGVDILDISGTRGIRGAQCKHRESWTTLSIKDIEDIVEAAEEFQPKLDHLLILTTAKRDTESQDAVLRINLAHKAVGKFEIELAAWGEIEDLLDKYPVAQAYGSKLPATFDSAVATAKSLVSLPAVLGGETPTSIDLEIDETKVLIETYRYREARLLLERIRTHRWPKLSDWQKFRVLTNLGGTYQGEADYGRAAKYFLEAKQWQPEEEKALANEAIAYDLLEDRPKAFQLAESLRSRFPQSARIVAIWIHAAPESYSAGDLEAKTPPEFVNDLETVLALCYRALVARDFERAVRFSRKAVSISGDNASAWLLLGQATLRHEFSQVRPSGRDVSKRMNRKVVQEAEESFSRAIDLGRQRGLTILVSQALVERAELRNLMGDGVGRARDIQEAYASSAEDVGVARAYAGLLITSGEISRSIDLLRGLKGKGGDDEVDALLAGALRDRHEQGDLKEAASLFARVVRSGLPMTGGVRELYLQSAIECFASVREWEEARAFLDDLPADLVDSCLILGLRGFILQATGDREGAIELARQCIALVNPTTGTEVVRVVAALCHRLSLYQECSVLMKGIRRPGDTGDDSFLLLECLSRIESHKEALDLCEELRQAGVDDHRVFEYEMHLLETYDFEQAIHLLNKRLTSHPSDKQARLRLALIGLREGRTELASATLGDLPSADEADPAIGRAVVQVLQFGGHLNEGLNYAYHLLRRHFNCHEAHLAFMSLFMPIGPVPKIPQPESVTAGTAVCYAEEGSASESWIVIEDSPDPDLERAEYGPSHQLALRLLGKKKGDAFDLAVGAVSTRKGVIRGVVNKYVFRFNDCVGQWQIRFPDIPAVESVTVVKQVGGEQVHDFSAIEKSVHARHEAGEQILKTYRTSILPINEFADRLQVSVYEAVASFASEPEVEVRCCTGSLEEHKTAHESLSDCTALVMDATALATMVLLEATDYLASWPVPIVVSQATLSELRALVIKQSHSGAEGGYFVKHEAGFAVVEKDPETEKSRLSKLIAVLNLIEQHCRVLPCRDLAALAPSKRRILTEVFGVHGVESMILASQPGCILWSDDWSVSGLAKSEFGARRVWTQLSLLWATEKGCIVQSDYATACAKLVGWRYFFTGLNVPILHRCGVLSKWNPDAWPLNVALDRFRGLDLATRDAAVLAAGMIKTAFRECSLAESRQAVIIRMLERLMARVDGNLIIGAIEYSIPRLFGIDVVGAREALIVVRGWKASRPVRTAFGRRRSRVSRT